MSPPSSSLLPIWTVAKVSFFAEDAADKMRPVVVVNRVPIQRSLFRVRVVPRTTQEPGPEEHAVASAAGVLAALDVSGWWLPMQAQTRPPAEVASTVLGILPDSPERRALEVTLKVFAP